MLGKVGQRRYPPRMTPQLRQEVMKAERYRAQFAFLRDNNIATQEDMAAFETRTEETLAGLIKQRTILNVRKKRRRRLYDALADVEALAPARQLYEDGLSGMERSSPGTWMPWPCWNSAPSPGNGWSQKRRIFTVSWRSSTARSGWRGKSWSCAGKFKKACPGWSRRSRKSKRRMR